MNETQALYKIALTKIDGVGPIIAKNLVSYCGSPASVFKESKRSLLKIPSVGLAAVDAILDPKVLKLAESELQTTIKQGINITFYLDKDYPSRLKHFPDSPCLIYHKGNANLDTLKTVGIIGTRTPTLYGKLVAEQLVSQLKEFKVTTISGLAHGIDTMAHKYSLQHELPTIAVMGGGFKSIYPAINRSLAQKILSNGSLITEFGYSSKPDREHFPMRNRIIAGLADAIVVVESAASGGSIITAEIGNNYNKDVFAIPGRTNDEKSAGCNKLIRSHKASLIENAEDLAYFMGWDKEETISQMTLPFENLDSSETTVIELLNSKEATHLDMLHYQSGLSLSKLSSILLNLEFKGMVKPLPGKSFMLCNT